MGIPWVHVSPQHPNRSIRLMLLLRRFSSSAQGTSSPAGIPYSRLRIGVPKETWTGERRVALSPAAVKTLSQKGFTVTVENNAGAEASFRNPDYEAAGAKVCDAKEALTADIVLKVLNIKLIHALKLLPRILLKKTEIFISGASTVSRGSTCVA